MPGEPRDGGGRLIEDDMRRTLPVVLAIGAALHGLGGGAQTHKVTKPEQVVRAVGVYEWTGDLKKPNASRLVPVSVFIDGALEDAGIYLARPIPFALTPGNEYELERAGVKLGALDLAYARHLQTADLAYEDGWFGYGSYKAPPVLKKEPALRASRNPAVLTSSKDDPRPHLETKGDAGSAKTPDMSQAGKDTQPNSTGATKPDSSQKSPDGAPADDPDRPTMHRRSDTSTAPTDTPSDGSAPANDPDRPTLRRRSPEDAKQGKKAPKDVATVTSRGSLNDDPDRPNLHRGAQSSANDTDIPKLVGVPKDLQQMVAISDAANRPPHDFALAWTDDKERAAVMAKMQVLARAQLLAYAADPLALQNAAGKSSAPKISAASQQRQPVRQTAGAHPAGRRSKLSGIEPAAKSAVPAAMALLEEDLRGYTLSFGGAPTYIYTAHTAGTGADLRYVTVVAQADVSGDLKPAIRSATDEAHLDRAPRMHFVDVVDAEASNRASLLFELRAQTTRQFALYRVIGTRSEAIFTTGTTQ